MSWTIRDYISNGMYSPPSLPHDSLKRIARLANAEVAAHLLFIGDRLFRSFLRPAGRSKALVDALHVHFEQNASHLARTKYTPSTIHDIIHASSLSSVLSDLGIPQLDHSVPSNTTVLERPFKTGTNIVILSGDTLSEPLSSHAIDALETLVDSSRCSVQFAVRVRWNINRECDRAVEAVEKDLLGNTAIMQHGGSASPDCNWLPTSDNRLITRMLRLLKRQTNSNRVAYFAISRETQSLDLSPFHVEADASPGRYPAELLKRAFTTHQPCASISSRSRNASLAYPISYRRFNTHDLDTVGVLYLRRSISRSSHGFSQHDFNYLDAVAMHMRRHHDWRMLHESASLIDQLSKPPLAMSHLDESWTAFSALTTAEHRDALPPGTTCTLPLELSACAPVIADALAGLYRLTRSRSVSMRMLTTNSRYLLRVFCLYLPPTGRAGHVFEIERAWTSSANAWVAKTGKSCDVPNIDKDEWRKRHSQLDSIVPARTGDSLKSLYCTPIRDGRRVIGTLNVESPYTDAFTVSQTTVDAVSSVIGESLRRARMQNEQLLHVSSPLGDAVHATRKLSRLIVDLGIRESHPEHAAHLDGLLTSLDMDSIELPGFGAAPDMPSESTAEFMVRQVCEKHRLVNIRIHATKPSVILSLNGQRDVDAFEHALIELIKNATGRISGTGQVEIRISTAHHSGCDWARIRISNRWRVRPTDPPAHALLEQYGRIPIRRERTVHWGALRAGATARQHLGGDVYVHALEDEYFAATLEVPCLLESTNDN